MRFGTDLFVHEPVVLLRCENTLQLFHDGVHALHLLQSGVALPTLTGIFEMHAIEGVPDSFIGNANLADNALRLLEGLFFGSALRRR